MQAIGIDIGGSNLRIASVGEDLIVSRTESYSLPRSATRQEIKDFVISKLNRFYKTDSSLGVGVAITGVITSSGRLISSNIDVFNDVPTTFFNDIFHKNYINIDNDVRCALRGEKNFGSAVGLNNVGCLTFGTGIGGALLLDGKIRKGPNNAAGELGMCCMIDPNTNQLVSIETAWKANFQSASRATLAEVPRFPFETSRLITSYPAAQLALQILNLHRIVDLELIILGGIVQRFGHRFIEEVIGYITSAFGQELDFKCRIELAKLGEFAGAVGAACLVLEKLGLIENI